MLLPLPDKIFEAAPNQFGSVRLGLPDEAHTRMGCVLA